jgi:acyl-[acyl-carrier-protein]-phospholipid O-acyltransferase/long-chain-fatty-acid--[acyl-carrier-protein] ligase
MNKGWKKGFWALMITQFQNGFSDLALKTLIVFLVLSRPMPESERDTYVALAGALFAIPFILFSMFGGWLADKFSKQKVMEGVKCAEIGIMLFATGALYSELLVLEMCAIFLMGCHSAIFGPSKYGILPEILPDDRLSWGNGILELLTFIGIILGTVAGGLFAEHFGGSQHLSGVFLTALACLGLIASRFIPETPAANPTSEPRINPVVDLKRQLLFMRSDRDLWRANWGSTGFWFVATLVQMNLTIYAKDVLSLTEQENGFLNAALALGIGLGSALAGLLSRGKIQYGLVQIGAIGMALCAVPMGFHGLGVTLFSLCLVGLGLSAGLFIVPVAAVLQHRPPPEHRGAVQGAANLMSFIGIFAVSAVQIVLNRILHCSPGEVFWICGIVALISGGYAAATRKNAIRDLLRALLEPRPISEGFVVPEQES